MNIDDYINYNGWEFSARMAFNQMNEYREAYPVLPRDKKVKLSHHFYDFVFRCNERPIEWESENSLGVSRPTADHPFSARVAHRAIMNENQHFLDDVGAFNERHFVFCFDPFSKETFG